MKVLLADDESSLCVALEMMLKDAGYEVCCAHDGIEAIAVFRAQKPDVVVLDVMMPRLDGFECCERLRQIDSTVPILMLSAKSDIVDKKVGFKAGADDYLTKPFNEEELLLRLEALLRRRAKAEGSTGLSDNTVVIQIGDMVIDGGRKEIAVGGNTVLLTPKEFQIIAHMAKHPGYVFSREDLIRDIWGEEHMGEAISIPVYVRRIREKIEDDPSSPRYLQTAWRHGYRLGD